MKKVNSIMEVIKKMREALIYLFILAFTNWLVFTSIGESVEFASTLQLNLSDVFTILFNVNLRVFILYFIFFSLTYLIVKILMVNKKSFCMLKVIAHLLLSYLILILGSLKMILFAPGFMESYYKKGALIFLRENFSYYVEKLDYQLINNLNDAIYLIIFSLLLYRFFKINKKIFFKFSLLAVSVALLTSFGNELTSNSNKDKLNILVLGVDSLRPDKLSYFGSKRKTSPNIDKFLKKSFVFTNAYTTIARTSPSITSMLTSLDPHVHQVRHMFPPKQIRKLEFNKLPNQLEENGFSSSVITDYAGEFFDYMNLGFSKKDVPPAFSLKSILARSVIFKHPLIFSYMNSDFARIIVPEINFLPILSLPSKVLDKTLAEFSFSEKPLFNLSFLSSVHLPYTITYPFYKKWDNESSKDLNKFAYYKRELDDLNSDFVRGEDEAMQINLLYDRSILTTDKSFGDFIKKFESSGYLDNTIVVLFSDHGENLPVEGTKVEHGTKLSMEDFDNRILLSIYIPNKLRSKVKNQAGNIDTQVSIKDVYPTILELLGLKSPSSLEGQSLVKLMNSEDGYEQRPIYLENGLSFSPSTDFADEDVLKYPSIFNLLKVENTAPYYFSIKKEFLHRVNQAKWRKLKDGHKQVIYIPNQEGVKYLYSVEDKEERSKLKTKLLKTIKKEQAIFLNGIDHVKYINN